MSADLEFAFLCATRENPADDTPWLVLADWLEERGEGERAELVIRLQRALRRPLAPRKRRVIEERVCALLAAGVRTCVAEVINSMNMRLALLPPGEYRQGASPGDPHPNEDEHPRRRVRISQAFYMGVVPVTQGEYAAVTDRDPSHFQVEADWNTPEGAYGQRGCQSRWCRGWRRRPTVVR